METSNAAQDTKVQEPAYVRVQASLCRLYRPAPPHTYRHELYEDYKGQRQACPEPVKEAVPRLQQLLAAMAIPVIQVGGAGGICLGLPTTDCSLRRGGPLLSLASIIIIISPGIHPVCVCRCRGWRQTTSSGQWPAGRCRWVRGGRCRWVRGRG